MTEAKNPPMSIQEPRTEFGGESKMSAGQMGDSKPSFASATSYETHRSSPPATTSTGTGTHAKQVASHVASETKSMVRTEVSRRTEQSAKDLEMAAQALRETGTKLEGNIASPYVEKAAEQLDRASNYLRHASFGDVVRTVEDFARREPLIFLGGAFAIGLVGARLLRGTVSEPTDQGGYTS
jgi:hypothetical protein